MAQTVKIIKTPTPPHATPLPSIKDPKVAKMAQKAVKPVVANKKAPSRGK